MKLVRRLRAFVYLRVSTEEQSAENQRRDCVRLVQARGWRVVEVKAETASAAGRRPVLEQALLEAHRGGYDRFVVWSLDRLGRSMVGNLELVLKLASKGVELVSVREPWVEQQGPTRELLIAIVGWVAEFERKRLGERTRAGLERARRRGIQLGRPKKRFNIKQALELLETMPEHLVAKKLRIGQSTLRRALYEKRTA
jgi:DNA invertase Pin-like site-specific DNA recombinase